MAAEIKPVSSSHIPKSIIPERPILISRIESTGENIRGVKLLKGSKTLFSICDDKSFRIWQRRDSGQYWPSVCHFLPSIPTCLNYMEDTNKLFLGLENGTIMEMKISEDLNSITNVRDYLAHQAQISSVLYSPDSDWVLSASRDKCFVYYCTDTGRRLGGHQASAWCTCLEYDALSKHAFVGNYDGEIAMLKLETNSCQSVTTLKGHSGSVRCLSWDASRKLLFSGSYDQVIIVWDVGGKRGTAYELNGHTSKVTGLQYLPRKNILISASEDCMVIAWDMNAKRLETPSWLESDSCQFCYRPFFWNIRAMVDQKQIGMRQHHCRKCGKAVCDTCSSKRSNIPSMGFEFEVRICDTCFQAINENDRISLARFQEVKHSVSGIDVDETSGIFLTAGQDNVMKIWDASQLLKSGSTGGTSTS